MYLVVSCTLKSCNIIVSVITTTREVLSTGYKQLAYNSRMQPTCLDIGEAQPRSKDTISLLMGLLQGSA